MNFTKIPTIAIVGRTNVGKSTLFNALVGHRVSIVEDIAGVTRDRHYGYVSRFEFPFTLIDTGGMIGEEGSGLEDEVQEQARIAIEEADVSIVLFDGIAGPHAHDKEIVKKMRRSGKKVIYVINKCEKPDVQVSANEFYRLGVPEANFVSAAHGVGIPELVDEIRDILDINPQEIEPHEKTKTGAIKLAIIGKPNVGKSSIINRILGEKRLITSDIAGTTRDSIDIMITRDGQKYQIVDTAGLRKKNKVDEQTVERYANLHALTSLASCDVAVMVMDASQGLPTEQDAKIAGLAQERGRGLILVMNKWDLVEKDHKSVKEYTEGIYEVFKFARYAPILFVSAETGRRCPSILETAKEVYGNWTHRIQTSKLNKILSVAWERKPPPVFRGQPIKLLFATQASSAPPEIVLFLNYPDKLNFSYQRYIKNTLRESFPFSGTDLKLSLRKRGEEGDVK
jgi:GTP-binding protein